MNIRAKIVSIVLPLIIAPLVTGGIILSFSARNGITQIATEFLQFKLEDLISYADSQWSILMENDMEQNQEFIDAVKIAIESSAKNLIRSDTELIVAFDGSGAIRLATSDVKIRAEETSGLARIISEKLSGWQPVQLNGEERIAQVGTFEPFEWTIFVTEKRDTFYRAISQMYWQAGFILGGASAISIVLLLVFSYFLTKPLRAVVKAMRDIITTNDLSKKVEILYHDEIGELGHSFNLMTGELDKAYEQVKGYALKAVIAQHKEQKIRNIFQKYVPKDVIDQFFANPEAMLVGEDRILAVLFSDIRSFTSISEKMQPNQIVESLNNYFGIMVDVIIRHRGIVDKYIGDAIMAFYGAPVSHEDEAYEAAMSGLEMIESLKDFNVWQLKRNRPAFRIGIGINYGLVTVGNIGSEKKMDYTVIGDMVNVASRLEGLTKKYGEQMIVSDSMHKFIENDIPCRMLDKVIVKGKTTSLSVYTPRRELKPNEREAWQLHSEALELYYNREFERAARSFEEIQKILSGDKCSQMFLGRCKAYIKSPPRAEWSGAVAMEEK